MKISTFRDWTVSIASIVFIIAVLSLSYYIASSIIKMNQQVAEYSNSIGGSQISKDVMESLNCYKDTNTGEYTAEINVQNTGDNLVKEFTCSVYDAGSLNAKISSVVISNLMPHSSDVCLFTFSGVVNNNVPIKFRFMYDSFNYTNFCMISP
jgi:hypothetical protein